MVVGQNFNQVLLLVGIQQGQQTQSISIQSVMVREKKKKKKTPSSSLIDGVGTSGSIFGAGETCLSQSSSLVLKALTQ